MKQLKIIGLMLVINCLLSGFTGNAQNKINSYQYWFDNEYSASTNVAVSPLEHLQLYTNISLENLTDGLHIFNIRFKDDNGFWSVPSTQFFYYSDLSDNLIECYQYWFDNEYSSNTLISVTSTKHLYLNDQLPLESLNEGLHLFSIRFKDSKGQWSVPLSQFIYKSNVAENANNKITAYRYWINDSIENAQYVVLNIPTTLLLLNEEIDFPGLANGEYTIHFQFKDAAGKWSVVTSDVFTLNNLTAVENNFLQTITAYPNPTNDIIRLDLAASFKSIGIEVFDNSGKLLQNDLHTDKQLIEISLKNYLAGIYYVRIFTNNKKATFQFIKN